MAVGTGSWFPSITEVFPSVFLLGFSYQCAGIFGKLKSCLTVNIEIRPRLPKFVWLFQ